VMSGFSTGCAFIIATSQLASFLGIKLRQTDFLPANWRDAIKQADDWNWCAIGMGASGLAMLYTLQVQHIATPYKHAYEHMSALVELLHSTPYTFSSLGLQSYLRL
jgi:MFS superfamily sulfate permease-like transporter